MGEKSDFFIWILGFLHIIFPASTDFPTKKCKIIFPPKKILKYFQHKIFHEKKLQQKFAQKSFLKKKFKKKYENNLQI